MGQGWGAEKHSKAGDTIIHLNRNESKLGFNAVRLCGLCWCYDFSLCRSLIAGITLHKQLVNKKLHEKIYFIW